MYELTDIIEINDDEWESYSHTFVAFNNSEGVDIYCSCSRKAFDTFEPEPLSTK